MSALGELEAQLARKQAELDAANAEIEALRAEVRKQVFGSRVVFDRAVVERAELDALRAELNETRAELRDFYKAKWRWEVPKPPYPVRMPQEEVIAKLEGLLAKDPFDRAALIESAYWDEGITYDWDEDIAALTHKVREHFEPGWQRLDDEDES